MPKTEISAGGIVYWREAGELRIQLIRDRYGRISYAKGKREPGETVEQTALREIKEETGVNGRIKELIDIIAYTYRHPAYGAVNKEVHYYLVEYQSGELKPQLEEIRSVDWYSPAEALENQMKFGYDNNDFILEKALVMLGVQL